MRTFARIKRSFVTSPHGLTPGVLYSSSLVRFSFDHEHVRCRMLLPAVTSLRPHVSLLCTCADRRRSTCTQVAATFHSLENIRHIIRDFFTYSILSHSPSNPPIFFRMDAHIFSYLCFHSSCILRKNWRDSQHGNYYKKSCVESRPANLAVGYFVHCRMEAIGNRRFLSKASSRFSQLDQNYSPLGRRERAQRLARLAFSIFTKTKNHGSTFAFCKAILRL